MVETQHQNHIYTTEFESNSIQHLSSGEFTINEGDGDTENLYKFFSTLAEAKEYAHKNTIAAGAQVDLNLDILDQDGVKVTIRRVHAGTGDWLFRPQNVRVVSAFKPCDTVHDLLEVRSEARRVLDETNKSLKRFEIDLSKVYMYRTGDKHEQIARAQAKLKANWDAAPTE